VFENRMLRRIFVLKRDEIIEGWRKFHNEELQNFYSLSDIIKMLKSRKMRRAWYVACVGQKRNACRVLVGKPEGNRPLIRIGRII
jgi:hypothetical protein